MDALTGRIRREVDVRTRQLATRLMRGVPNPTHFWHGESTDCSGRLRLLRLGDCSWHVIEHGHAYGRPGYPALLDRHLRDDGVALRFQDCFVGKARDIDPPTLTRVCKGDPPDAIIVHMGCAHGALELVPLYRLNLLALRMRVNLGLGRLGGALHRRVIAPVAGRFGRPLTPMCTPEQADAGFERLTGWIDANCPGAPWAILPPHPAIRRGWSDPARIAAATEIYSRAALAHGGAFLDYRERLATVVAERGERAVYGATGYDLLAPGHAVIEEMLHEWLTGVAPAPGASQVVAELA